MTESPVPVVCSVGTIDPWNAAGLGLDVRVLEAFGVRPVTIVAGVSAQGPGGITSLVPLSAESVAAQFASLAAAHVAAYRVGALLDAPSVEAVANELGRTRAASVVDPVLGATLGGRFADDETIAALRTRLVPSAGLITPNLAEARALARLPDAAPRDAARALLGLGARAVLVTGIAAGDDVVDLLLTPGSERRYAARRIAAELRGTGCMLAAGIAASLACGSPLEDAIDRARAFVRARFEDAETIAGMRVMGVRGRQERGS